MHLHLLRFYLCCQCLHRLQVEVVVQMQVVEVLTVDEQVEHVVALPAHLQPDFNPIQLGGLEEFCGFKGSEQVPVSRRRIKVLANSYFKLKITNLCVISLTSFSEPLVVCA